MSGIKSIDLLAAVMCLKVLEQRCLTLLEERLLFSCLLSKRPAFSDANYIKVP